MLVDDISEVLGKNPGLTVAEIASALLTQRLRAQGRQDPRVVALALFNGHERFRCDRGLPPRWWLVANERHIGEAAPQFANSRAASFDRACLYPWQREALDSWAAAGYRGVVEAVTGSGKTMLGVAAAADELRRRSQVLVVVPSVDLMHQWRRLMSPLLSPGYLVGCLGDGETAGFATADVVIAVVNSLRASDIQMIRGGGLLVADECHRYATAMNRLALDQRIERRLGLSATYARDDDGHIEWLDPFFGGTCFRMGYRRAVDDGVTARFRVALVGVALPPSERARYEELSAEIGQRYARLVERYHLPTDSFGQFIKAVNRLGSGVDSRALGVSEARAYLGLLLERRRLLADTPAKMRALAGLAPAIAEAERSIVFTRSIATAEISASILAHHGLRAEAVHSRMGAAERREMLRRFADGDLQVISAPRVLDEGVDLPEADLAVIVGASRSRRQMIQRMGRVLRKKPDHRPARFALLVTESTIEDPGEGAHAMFLEEITEVADEVCSFGSSSGSFDASIAFLRWRAEDPRPGR
jgi:superfamily II DNA or RNA helicase